MGKQKKVKIPMSQKESTPLGSMGLLFELAGIKPSFQDEIKQPDLCAQKDHDDYDLSSQKSLHIHFERKGHGGKTVTIISGFTWDDIHTTTLANKLKKALGCGAKVKDHKSKKVIVLQGDIKDRVCSWLETQIKSS